MSLKDRIDTITGMRHETALEIVEQLNLLIHQALKLGLAIEAETNDLLHLENNCFKLKDDETITFNLTDDE